MSFRRAIMALAVFLFTGPAMAEDFVAPIVSQLKRDGYSNIVVEYTFLGRVQIRATHDGLSREVVVNPRTGEILRDLRTRPASDRTDDDRDDDDGDDDGNQGGDDEGGDDDGDSGEGGNSGSGGGGDGDD